MEKTNYRFNAVTRDIDVARIFKENEDADFIRIAVRGQIVYLFTPGGFDRMTETKLLDHAMRRECPKICPDYTICFTWMEPDCNCGTLRFSEGSVATVSSNYFQKGSADRMDLAFEKFYALLRERECKPVRVDVSAII